MRLTGSAGSDIIDYDKGTRTQILTSWNNLPKLFEGTKIMLNRIKQTKRIIGIVLACVLMSAMTFGGFPQTAPCDASAPMAEIYVPAVSRSFGVTARAYSPAAGTAAAVTIEPPDPMGNVRRAPARHHIDWVFSVYREPDFRATRVVSFNPQYVSVIYERDDEWALISTYRGELWTPLRANMRFIEREMALYASPDAPRPTASISPQVINIMAQDRHWLQIGTWLGPMWIRMPATPPPDAKLVALTFDDGPSEYTPRLLDALGARSVPATFFVTGNRVNAEPEIAARIVEEGHEIACHTFSHPHLASMSADRIRTELNRSREAIFQATGRVPTVFRPSYGAHNATVRAVAEEFYMPLILWTIDTRDWESRNVSAIMNHISDSNGNVRVNDGDIILMHDTFNTTVDAAVQMVDLLLAEGFYFVTVSQLLFMRYGEIEPGRVYNSARRQEAYE